MLNRIFHENPSIVMPPPESNLILSDYEKEILKKWILQGGKWKKHWSYNKPIKPQLPDVKNKSWINMILIISLLKILKLMDLIFQASKTRKS